MILKTYPTKLMILNVDFALKLSNYRSFKRFICLKRILKNSLQYCILSSTTRHCQSLYLMYSVPPPLLSISNFVNVFCIPLYL